MLPWTWELRREGRRGIVTYRKIKITALLKPYWSRSSSEIPLRQILKQWHRTDTSPNWHRAVSAGRHSTKEGDNPLARPRIFWHTNPNLLSCPQHSTISAETTSWHKALKYSIRCEQTASKLQHVHVRSPLYVHVLMYEYMHHTSFINTVMGHPPPRLNTSKSPVYQQSILSSGLKWTPNFWECYQSTNIGRQVKGNVS